MKVMAEVSLYPMRVGEVLKHIVDFCDAVEAEGLEIERGAMSAVITGESGDVFAAVQKAYDSVGAQCQAAVVIKVYNAKPGPCEG